MAHNADILPVIICGGAGSRLWPLSRKAKPKQFADLIGEQSLFQDTLLRFSGDAFLPPAVICNASHMDMVQEQAAAINMTLGPIVLEPVGRNTAACGVVSALLGQAAESASAVLMAPADHHITRPEAFAKTVLSAKELTDQGHLVTFGITPSGPHTGFGYIQCGPSVLAGYEVQKFHEKPSLERAQSYLDSGGFFWNAGIFMFGPDFLLSEFDQHAPDVLSAVKASASHNDSGLSLDTVAFKSVPDISFDYAIAERTERAVVVEADIGWSDIGSYAALFELRDKLGQPATPKTANVKAGENVYIDRDDPNLMVAVAGLDNVGVVIREGRVLVVNLNQDQAVKSIVQTLPDEKR